MKWKLTIAMSALFSAISLMMAGGIYFYIKRDYLAAINNNRVLVVGTLATSVFEALLREDMSSLSFLGEQFAKQRDILSVIVLDQKDTVVYDSRHQHEGEVIKGPETPLFKPAIVDGKEAVEVTVPYKIGEKKWAVASVTYSMATVNENIIIIFRIVSLFGLLGIALGLAASIALSRWITRPIGELAAGINAIESGNMDYRISIGSHDELEMVGNEFNSMTARLKESHKELLEKEKMSAILELAGAAAHEINQPLTVIIGNIDFLLSQGEIRDAKMIKTLETINRSARELADIVKKMARIRRYETDAYVGKVKILDIEKSSKES